MTALVYSGSDFMDAVRAADDNTLPESRNSFETQIWDDSGSTSSPAIDAANTPCGSAGEDSNFTDDQACSDAHTCIVVGDPTPPAAMPGPESKGATPQGGATSTGEHQAPGTQNGCLPGGFLRDPVIGVLADVLDDLETVRIANANRVRILTRNEADSDGENRGFGLTEDHPEVAKLALTVKALEAAEHDAILNLQRALRKHPLAAFQKRHKGLGEKQFARLLAAIGDPYWNDLHDRPRTVSELWAYSGFHVLHPGDKGPRGAQTLCVAGVAPKRQRGQQSNWSETARKRTWVIASAMPKFPGGHYEQVYRQAREKYADAVHPADCVRCGPSGKPALAGTPLSDGHKHARAIRIVAKELLKDIWRESRDLYEQEATQ